MKTFSVLLVIISLSFLSTFSWAKDDKAKAPKPEDLQFVSPGMQEAVEKAERIDQEKRGPRETEANPAVIGLYCPTCIRNLTHKAIYENTLPSASSNKSGKTGNNDGTR
ncbi:MAG: hypothetical protein ACXVCP_16770 [Bdellovibrio sp.]